MPEENIFKMITDRLGVGLNEEFKLGLTIARITEIGYQEKARDGHWFSFNIPNCLLTGEKKIKKIIYLPKAGTRYWTFSVTGDIVNETWYNIMLDRFRYQTGLVFRTKEETEKNTQKLQDLWRNKEE